MAELSRHGVCYDLEDSPYSSERMGWLFMFSSQPHKEKFDEGVGAHIMWLNDSMKRRFGFRCDFRELAVFNWYRRCETRGFCVYKYRDDAICYDKVEDLAAITAMVGGSGDA